MQHKILFLFLNLRAEYREKRFPVIWPWLNAFLTLININEVHHRTALRNFKELHGNYCFGDSLEHLRNLASEMTNAIFKYVMFRFLSINSKCFGIHYLKHPKQSQCTKGIKILVKNSVLFTNFPIRKLFAL